MNTEKSKKLFKDAKKYIPGGVNSPVRAFKSVGSDPLFIKKGLGSKFWDVDGNEYIDYIGSWGPHLFGHNPPFIIDALKSTPIDCGPISMCPDPVVHQPETGYRSTTGRTVS